MDNREIIAYAEDSDAGKEKQSEVHYGGTKNEKI